MGQLCAIDVGSGSREKSGGRSRFDFSDRYEHALSSHEHTYEQFLPLPFCAHCSNKTSIEGWVLQEFYYAHFRVGEVGILESLQSIIDDVGTTCNAVKDEARPGYGRDFSRNCLPAERRQPHR